MTRKSFHIVVAGRDAYKSASFGLFIAFDVFTDKFGCIAASFEEGLIASEQIIVMRRAEMQKEVHMESPGKTLIGLSPFGHHGGFRKFFIEEFPYILPERNGSLTFRIVLDKGTCHINAESVASHGKPETHYILDLFPGSHGTGCIHGLLPGFFRFIESVIKSGLMGEEIDYAASVTV